MNEKPLRHNAETGGHDERLGYIDMPRACQVLREAEPPGINPVTMAHTGGLAM